MRQSNKKYFASEKLLIEEIGHAALCMKTATRGLSIGGMIKLMRTQLGMSQRILAKRAGVPQSTISRIEQGGRNMSLFILQKILSSISCELVVGFLSLESVEAIRLKQAKQVATKQISYLQGTMNLEDQQPDSRFIVEMLKQEEQRLLQGPSSKLWEE